MIDDHGAFQQDHSTMPTRAELSTLIDDDAIEESEDLFMRVDQ